MKYPSSLINGLRLINPEEKHMKIIMALISLISWEKAELRKKRKKSVPRNN
jgi:hypothetical protein